MIYQIWNDLRPGEQVMAVTVPPLGRGGYAEFITVPETWVTHMPGGLGFFEAATLPMNGLTALLALDWLDLPEGSQVAVTGGTGAVGRYAISIARSRGIRVTVSGHAVDRDELLKLGAEKFVLRTGDLVQEFLLACPEGFAAVVDAAAIGEPLLDILMDRGKFAALRDFGSLKSGIRVVDRGIQVHRLKVSDYVGRADRLNEIKKLAEQGILTTAVADVLPAELASEAHHRLERGGIRGRIVLQFADS